MSQLEASINTMMTGLNGMIKSLDSQMKTIQSNMTPEQAIEFAKAMDQSDVKEKIKDLEKFKVNNI